ncbi:hypothetical protein ADU37_CDS21640 [Thermococcus sp. 2319x1]|nr:hypothetical protein ADU37_CDS21640 [Thermococcus sp. 2319x1]
MFNWCIKEFKEGYPEINIINSIVSTNRFFNLEEVIFF